MSNTLRPHELQSARLICPWNSPGKNTRVGCLSILQGIFLTQGWNPARSPALQADSLQCVLQGSPNLNKVPSISWGSCVCVCVCVCVCMLSSFNCVQLIATLWAAVQQAPLPLGSSRQEYWSALPCPSLGDLPDPGIESASHYVSCIGRQVSTSATWEVPWGSYQI